MTKRIHLLDALRGLSLAGICLAHFSEQYLGNMEPAAFQGYARHGVLDTVAEAIIFILVRGKGFALFSFLFGVSLALQMDRAREREAPGQFYPRFVWRLVLLFGIGFAHSLLYRGDILTIYALLGLPLLLMSRAPGRWLLIGAAVLFLGAPRIFVAATQPPMTKAELGAKEAAMEGQAVRHWEAVTDGRVLDMVRLNLTDSLGLRNEFQFGAIGRGYQTLGYFMLGLWAGRRRLFELVDENLKLFRRIFRWGVGVTVGLPVLGIGLAAVAWLASGGGGGRAETQRVVDPTNWAFVAGITVYDLWNLAMTLAIVAGFVLLFRRQQWQPRLLRLAPVGKLALSNYLLQTVVGTFIFYGFGLGLLGRVGSSVTMIVALALFAVQTVVSRWWQGRFRYGPVEWLWRSLTRLSAQPFLGAA